MSHSSSVGFGTKCIHSGVDPDPVSGAVITPISMSSTFQQKSPGVHSGFEYSRSGNPTRKVFQDNVAALENGKWGLAFASGSAALCTIIDLIKSGDEVICMDDVYGGTYRFLSRVAINHGITTKKSDFRVISQFEALITPKTKLVWVESPTNPLLKIVDIAEIAKITKKHNLIFVVDNTFVSPYFQNPLTLGADLVVHSVTKYLNGHSDVVMGVVCGNDLELHERLKFLQNAIGAIPSPFDCWLALRGIKTLHVRMEYHQKNAIKVAEYLEKHDKVAKVIYPGLKSHPDHVMATKQMRGYGGMISFYIKGGIHESRQFLENLKIWALAESLGGVESLVNHPAIMTHASIPLEDREKLGIKDNFVRLSVGIEDSSDLIADLDSAFNQITSEKK
eukprot:TRINITY_DN6557_c0_g1_i4.p1 TRINITY_DN6557_c0_g1~~TRINITY_DN6557_c0_g1_i4.p1  ORF type:complete len:392 (+),score=71.54 TRINITY_DN6557_c0_g1_i4:48-1223(+)